MDVNQAFNHTTMSLCDSLFPKVMQDINVSYCLSHAPLATNRGHQAFSSQRSLCDMSCSQSMSLFMAVLRYLIFQGNQVMALHPWPYIRLCRLLTCPYTSIRRRCFLTCTYVVEPMHPFAAVIHVAGHAPRPRWGVPMAWPMDLYVEEVFSNVLDIIILRFIGDMIMVFY